MPSTKTEEKTLFRIDLQAPVTASGLLALRDVHAVRLYMPRIANITVWSKMERSMKKPQFRM